MLRVSKMNYHALQLNFVHWYFAFEGSFNAARVAGKELAEQKVVGTTLRLKKNYNIIQPI